MTTDQVMLFSLLGLVFALLIWGRIRYDLVAFGALILAVIAGLVPQDRAFEGFGHHATVIIALVLIVSRGLSNSGAIEIVARHVVDASRSLFLHIGVMSVVAAVLSAIMNNVAALALLMPIDVQAARKAGRSAAMTLMPISFASILGGLITLIGTPPNIIVASYRNEVLGEPFGMFDFSPVGLTAAIAGVVFIVFIGWRLIPVADRKSGPSDNLHQLGDYIAEVKVVEDSSIVGRKVRDLDDEAEDADVVIAGIVRNGRRLSGRARREEIRVGDMLVIEADAHAIDAFVGAFKLAYQNTKHQDNLLGVDMSLVEVVVPEGARIEGRTALSVKLMYRHGVSLLGVSRGGRSFRERVRKLTIRAGDILLLLGPSERVHDVAHRL